jgi:hypothetical protein
MAPIVTASGAPRGQRNDGQPERTHAGSLGDGPPGCRRLRAGVPQLRREPAFFIDEVEAVRCAWGSKRWCGGQKRPSVSHPVAPSRAINLRNKLAHGHAGANLLGVGIANWVMRSLVTIRAFGVISPQERATGTSAQ